MQKILLILTFTLALALRFFQLGLNPPSLTWDEASLGYNAFSILTSGRDEHGEFLPVARFIAFGDYKPPGYIYAATPFVAFWGLTEIGVRLPSALAGMGMVIFTYLLVREIFSNKKLAILASFLLGISAWSLHFSRAAYESNLAAFFNLVGIYFFYLSLRKKWSIIASIIFFVLSFYTFNANRIIAPLMLLGLSALHLKKMINNKKWVVVAIVVGFLMILPSFSFLQTKESRVRFQEVSIFNNLVPIKISNERIALDGSSLLARMIHNRRVLFAVDFLKHYFDNFKLRFLFTHGDVNPRLAVQNMGQLYVFSLPFLFLGVYFGLKKRPKALLSIILWMAIVPIPAGTARETPHALRILSILPTYQIITAYGLYQFVSWLGQKFSFNSLIWLKVLLLFLLCSLLSINIFYYLHDYYIHFPRDWSGEWQYGYKQMVEYVAEREDKYDKIFITRAQGRPYIFFAFYQKMPFEKFFPKRIATRDWFGFWKVKSLGKIRFDFDGLSTATGRILLVTTPGNIPSNYRLLTRINNLRGEAVFVIAERM